MKPGALRGWIKAAYPGVVEYPQSDVEYYYSDDRRDIQCILDRVGLKFPQLLEHYICTDEHSAVLACVATWGSPKTEFRFSENSYGKPPKGRKTTPKKQKPVSSSSPKPEAPSKKSSPAVGGLSGRAEILRRLKEAYGENLSTEKLQNGSVKVSISGIPGPILYDYGVSPWGSQGSIFIPYAHKSEVTKLLEDYLKGL